MPQDEVKDWGRCYFAVMSHPDYVNEDEEFDPMHESRRNHLCAHPLVVREAMEQDPNITLTSLLNEGGTPMLIPTLDLNGFVIEEPAACASCNNYFRNPGYNVPMPELGPALRDLAGRGLHFK